MKNHLMDFFCYLKLKGGDKMNIDEKF